MLSFFRKKVLFYCCCYSLTETCKNSKIKKATIWSLGLIRVSYIKVAYQKARAGVLEGIGVVFSTDSLENYFCLRLCVVIPCCITTAEIENKAGSEPHCDKYCTKTYEEDTWPRRALLLKCRNKNEWLQILYAGCRQHTRDWSSEVNRVTIPQ